MKFKALLCTIVLIAGTMLFSGDHPILSELGKGIILISLLAFIGVSQQEVALTRKQDTTGSVLPSGKSQTMRQIPEREVA